MKALLDRTGLIDSKYHTVEYLLFSKSGFSDWVINNSALIILLDLFRS